MDEPSVSSLERFLRAHGEEFTPQRAPDAVGHLPPRAQSLISTFAGMAISVFVVLALAHPGGLDYWPALIAFVVAFVFSAAVVSGKQRKRASRRRAALQAAHKTPRGVSVSPQAQAIVSALLNRHVWTPDIQALPVPNFSGDLFQPRILQMRERVLKEERAKSDRVLASIPASSASLLEDAAREYNRTAGYVDSAGDSDSLRRLGPSIMGGADEAMAGFLHRLAQTSEFPESARPSEAALTAHVEKLRELADRVEALRMQQEQPAEDSGELSKLTGVLEELRLEQLAMTELSQTEPEPLQKNIQA